MAENCIDIDGHTKGKIPKNYVIKGMRRVWPADEEMNAKLKCIDNAHSKQYDVSEQVLKQLEDDLNDYAKRKTGAVCPQGERDIIECIKSRKSMYSCSSEISHFVQCLNEVVVRAYQQKKGLRRDLT